MNVNPGKWPAIGAVVLSAAALLCAAPAAADQNDDAFVAALHAHGIAMTDRSTAIATAHTLCSGLDKGETPTHLVLDIVKTTNLNAREAGYLLGASVASYCPQYRGEIANSVS